MDALPVIRVPVERLRGLAAQKPVRTPVAQMRRILQALRASTRLSTTPPFLMRALPTSPTQVARTASRWSGRTAIAPCLRRDVKPTGGERERRRALSSRAIDAGAVTTARTVVTARTPLQGLTSTHEGKAQERGPIDA